MIIEADKGFKLEHFEGKESLFPKSGDKCFINFPPFISFRPIETIPILEVSFPISCS